MKRSIAALVILVSASLAGLARAETLQEVLDKNTQALGGREALDKVQSVTRVGKVRNTPQLPNVAPIDGYYRTCYQVPDKAYMTQTIAGTTLTMATDGKVYWETNSARPLAPPVVTGARAEGRIEDARVSNTYLANWPKVGAKLEYLGIEKVDGREAYVIKKTLPYGFQSTEYIDRTTGLTIKETSETQESRPSDWRKVDGVLMPFKLVMTYASPRSPYKTVEITWDSIKINAPVADSLFDPPVIRTPAP